MSTASTCTRSRAAIPPTRTARRPPARPRARTSIPTATKAHKGPGGGGHKGDLPKLVVSDKGEAKDKIEVKGVTLADFQGHALMIHAGGDNYSDAPKPLGGGGERIACGVAK